MEPFRITLINQTGNTMINTHFHDAYEVFFLLEGTRDFFIKNHTYTILPNSIVFLSPKVIHKTIARDSGHVKRYVLMIPKEFVHSLALNYEGNLFDCFLNCSPVLSLDNEKHSHILRLFEQIYLEYESDGDHHFILSLLVTELLYFLNRYNSDNKNLKEPIKEDTLSSQVIEILTSKYEESIVLEDISKQLYISTYQLCRVFKHETGFTVMEYLTHLRLHEAMHLLDTTNHTVTRIGFTVGFNNTNHFIRIFRQKVGITPKQYQLKRNG